MEPAWKKHEADVANMLGLRPTICSGNKFFDQGDSVTPGRGDSFPLYVDCKCTNKSSASFKLRDLSQWQEQAALAGKRFLLALRFDTTVGEGDGTNDWVVLSLHDFTELLTLARSLHDDEVQG